VTVGATVGNRGWIAGIVILAFGAAALIVLLLPRIGAGGAVPPVTVLMSTGLLVAVVTTGGLAWIIRQQFRLPVVFLLYAVGYNLLVVVVKFILAPQGVYDLNRTVPFESVAPINEPVGAVLAAALVLVLYVLVYTIIYRLVRRRVLGPRRWNRKRMRRLVLLIIGAALLLGATGSLAVLYIPVVVAWAAAPYLQFVFSSGVSVLVAVALAGATALCVLAFSEAATRSRLVGEAGTLVAFFWVGLAFLALYHLLWVVYILVLTSLWPLKVVVPK
jgi:hypothetical protein